MTPQLQQAIKLLQLSNSDLLDFVDQELANNPLLEQGEANDEAVDPSAVADDSATAATEDGAAPELDTLDLTASENMPGGGEQPLDATYENDDDSGAAIDWAADGIAFDTRGGTGGGGGSADDGGSWLDQTLGEQITLRQHLLLQLQMEFDDPVDRMIGVHLIDLLDGAGYLTGDLDALAETLGCDGERIEATLERLQRFEPTGVFARSLKECLALQLAERDRLDPAMAILLENLDLLAGRDAARLKALCGVDDEDLAQMVTEIKELNPKPAEAFDHAVAEPVVPDVLMRPHPKEGWLLELNSETLPRVLANRAFYAHVVGQCRSKTEKEYVSEQFQSANWLVKSLNQRANTILKVATEIVRRQDAFFRKGVQHLRPLILRDIAEAIEMHESTVSRATANKYIATPRGTYELKYFFSTSIAGTGAGASHSAEAVRDRIKRLIDGEASTKILSDDTIVDLLRAEGIEIARRTVAKYREAMGIPSSVQRRRDKRQKF
jgi:RNA polymerase sigma-54 factor